LGRNWAYACSGRERAQNGAALRVNVQLVSTETGAHLWADHFERSLTDTLWKTSFANIALALWFRVAEVESTRIARERSDDADAADALMRGRAAVYGRQRTRKLRTR